MAFENQILDRLVAITNTLNAIQANSKRTEEFPHLEPLDNTGKIRVSVEGVSFWIAISEISSLIDALGFDVNNFGFDLANSTSGSSTTEQEIVDYINSIGFTVNTGNLIQLSIVVKKNDYFYVKKYNFRRNNITGNWGTEFENGEINISDLVETGEIFIGNVPSGESDVLFNLGDIGSDTIFDYINARNTTLDPYRDLLDDGSVYYFSAIINGDNQIYRYVGSLPKTIGQGQDVLVFSDFDLISNNAPVPTLQEVTNNGATTDHVIELEGVKFNELRVTGATSSVLGTTGTRPYGITIDSDGNIYTTNSGSSNVSKITPDGVSTILGTTGTNPFGITIDSEGNVYTANTISNNVSKITPSGTSSILGTTGNKPFNIIIDSEGNIYTVNQGSNNVSKITPSGVSTILGNTGNKPFSITIDSEGNIYTTNSGSSNVSKITPDGVSTILGTTGSNPRGITIDSEGNIYTTNFDSNNVTKITPSGVSTILGNTGSSPYGIAVDSEGNIYTTNFDSNNVTKITPSGVSTILGNTGSSPTIITIDSEGNIYTTNFDSNNVTKITPTPKDEFLSLDENGNIIVKKTPSDSASTLQEVTENGATTDKAIVATNTITATKFIDSDGTDRLTGTVIDLSNNIDGTIYNNVTPSAAASFSVVNLKSGGFATNYIDTTGKTDFPTVTNASGEVIPTQSDAFRADAEFLMILETLNGEDVEVCFVDYLNLDPIGGGGDKITVKPTLSDATYTLTNSDVNKVIVANNTDTVITVNDDSITRIGDVIYIDYFGTGTCEIAQGSTILLTNSNDTLFLDGQYSRVAVQKMSATQMRVFGQLIPA